MDVVSEVREDGYNEITETAHVSNYEMQVRRLDTKLPESIPTESLSDLFNPKRVLDVTLEDGTVISFVYKKVDPATLMITHESPLAIDPEQAKVAYEKFEELEKRDQDGDSTAAADLNELVSDKETMDTLKKMMQIRKLTVQSGVISPEITDDLYEDLPDEIINTLQVAITGGITNQNELVEHFRRQVKAPKQS